MAVDVVVINYHTDELLSDFLVSYVDHRFEGCTLTTVEVEAGQNLITSFGDSQQSIRVEDNIGYARACNVGAICGRNDVILLANADTQLSADLRECHDTLIAHDDWGILGPRQVDSSNRLTAGGILGPVKSPRQRHWQEPDNGQASDIIEDAYSVSGSLYFIKRSVWNELTNCEVMQQLYPDITGAFIPTPHYFEETTCSRHAIAHGYKCVFYGPAKMLHHWHAASDHGGWADKQFNTSLTMHREFCDAHRIEHE